MSSDSDNDQFTLSSSEDESVDPVVKDAKKVAAAESSASEDDSKSKPAEPAKGDDDKVKKQPKAKPEPKKKPAKAKKDDAKPAKAKQEEDEAKGKGKEEDEEEAKGKKAAKSRAKGKDEAKQATKAKPKKNDEEEAKTKPKKAPAKAKKSEPAKAKSKKKTAAKDEEEEYDSVHSDESSSEEEEDESEDSTREMIDDDAEDSDEGMIFDEPQPAKTSKSKPKATPKKAAPKKPAAAKEPAPSKKGKKASNSDDDNEATVEVKVAATKRPSSSKRPREDDEDVSSVDSASSFEPFDYKPTGTMIDIDNSFEEWKIALNDILADEETKEAFLKSFEGADFISNFSIRNFKDDDAMDEYIQRMKKQYLLRLKSNDDTAKELIRLMTARELRDVLRENGIDIKGLASENRNKASKKTPSSYAHPLPKGYRRPDDDESVKGKEAKIVYIGNPSHLSKDSGRSLPAIPIHFKDEHKVIYGPDLEKMLFVSTISKAYESLHEKNKNITIPLEQTIRLSSLFKKRKTSVF